MPKGCAAQRTLSQLGSCCGSLPSSFFFFFLPPFFLGGCEAGVAGCGMYVSACKHVPAAPLAHTCSSTGSEHARKHARTSPTHHASPPGSALRARFTCVRACASVRAHGRLRACVPPFGLLRQQAEVLCQVEGLQSVCKAAGGSRLALVGRMWAVPFKLHLFLDSTAGEEGAYLGRRGGRRSSGARAG